MSMQYLKQMKIKLVEFVKLLLVYYSTWNSLVLANVFMCIGYGSSKCLGSDRMLK